MRCPKQKYLKGNVCGSLEGKFASANQKQKPYKLILCPTQDPDLFRQWQEILPQHHRQLKQHDRVCEKHFREQDIVRFWQHTINGQKEVILRDKPTLKPRTVPVYDHQEMLAKIAETEAQPKKPVRRKTRDGAEGGAGPAKVLKFALSRLFVILF